MDRLNPSYRQARSVYAGHSSSANALEAGRQAVKLHPDQVSAELNKLTPGEQVFYRRGFTQRIIEDVENSPDRVSAVNRIFGTKMKRDRIRAIVGDEEYARLEQRFGIENNMSKTDTAVLGGPATAQRLAEQQDLEVAINGMSPEVAGGLAGAFATGTLTPLLHAVGMTGVANLLRGIGRQTREVIVDMLFSNDPKQVRRAVGMIAKEYKAAQDFNKFQRELGAAGAGAGDDVRGTQQAPDIAAE
jgi:hypothetical protein